MRTLMILIGVVATVATTSCKRGAFCIKPHGDEITETREVDIFHGVDLDGAFDIVIKQDKSVEKGEVVIEGPSDVMEHIKTNVRNGILHVNNKRCFRGDVEITVYVTSDEIDDISLCGAGDIHSDGALNASDMKLLISGAGNMNLELYCDKLEAKITGAGNIDAFGEADEQKLKITGSGNIEHFGIASKKVDAEIDGSGNIEVEVSETLDARIDGSGNIIYRGYPDVTSKVTGSGDIKSDN